MASDSSLTISKLNIESYLPNTLSAPEKIDRQFRKIARENLSESLIDLLKPLDETGEQIVLIRGLELTFDIDLLLSRQQIALVWANKIKSAILQAMSGKASSNVVVFENFACYVKSALVDIVRGRAQQLWYYRRFNGLWALPVSAAIRTLLLDDRDKGLAALMQMSGAELVELCAALIEQDAKWLTQHLFQENAKSGSTQTLSPADMNSFVTAVGDNYTLAYSLGKRHHEKSLLLACLAIRQQAGHNSSVAVQCARHLSLLLYLQNEFPDTFTQITEALIHNRPAELKRWLTAERIAELVPLLHLDAKLVNSLVELICPAGHSADKRPAQLEKDTRFTWFGNALLLLPQIEQLPLEALQLWQPLRKQSVVSVVQLLTLNLCQGADKFVVAFRDPLLRDLCGVGPDIILTDVVQWLNEQATQQRLADICQALKDTIVSDGQPLLRFEWHAADKLVVAYSEARKGCWVDLTITDHHARIARIPQSQAGEKLDIVIADFNTLWLANRWQLSDNASACLSLLAQVTMKSFAYRLPGFAQSSVHYLLQNFLPMSATLVAEEHRIMAYLSRVPMSIILNMTGMNRSSLQLQNFDQRSIHLTESG